MAKQIDNYKLGEPLGIGTVGSVFLAEDLKTGQKVALKILLPAVSEDNNIAARFQREIYILEKLKHKNIVRYLADGRHEGRLYYTMELVNAGSIKAELAIHGRLPWREVCRYGIQICSALQFAHNHGIIHRDLKPSNLFLNEEDQIKLGDFGIARETGGVDFTDEGMTVGTYAYMSPEQIRADHEISPKTDLYALGCLLFEILTGRPPFEGRNFAQIFDQHLNSEPPSVCEQVADCPPELDTMIRQLMAKDPEKRPLIARNVQGLLLDLLDKAPPEKRPDANYRSRTEAPSWALLVGIMAALTAIVAAIWLFTQGPL